MQNLVRATGRSVWYLNDPIEDNPGHDWTDYRTNWESTLVASLLQPDVWQYEVAPWPERIFDGKYPRTTKPEDRKSIPSDYATELQIVMQALADLRQPKVQWDCGTRGIGVLVSDSMMFQREQPTPSDPNMAQFYGLAMPLVKRGIPVTPVQLENVMLPGFLEGQRVLVLSYQGQKPLSADVHPPLADWVREGGVLLVVDDDSDPYNQVREWWNRDGEDRTIPRQHLFAKLGLKDEAFATGTMPSRRVGKGVVIWVRETPVHFALSQEADVELTDIYRAAAMRAGLAWNETAHLAIRRGPYVIGGGLDESIPGTPKVLKGRFVNLFDPELRVQRNAVLNPGARVFLLDLDAVTSKPPRLLASAAKALPRPAVGTTQSWTVEGVGNTPAVFLFSAAKAPKSVKLDHVDVEGVTYEAAEGLLRVRFPNESRPRTLELEF